MIFFTKTWGFRQLRFRRALQPDIEGALKTTLLRDYCLASSKKWLARFIKRVSPQNLILLFLALSIPNSFLSCKAKDKTDNSGLQAAATAKQLPVESLKSSSSRDSSKIDLDLTKMSATMIYSTIFDMLIMPEDYVDKTIKVKGWFQTYTDHQNAELYYAVVVPDATACCQQGLEFVWFGEHEYPEDFPELGQDITVTGVYKLIENDGITYNYLEASKVEF